MQPQHLRKLVRKWALAVAALAAVGAIVAFVVSKAMTPIYQAKGDVLVVAGVGQGGSSAPADVTLNATEATTTAATLITAPPLLQSVIDAHHLGVSVSTLAGNVAATPQANSELVDVTVTDPSPKRAAQIDNAIMTAFVAQITKQNTDRIDQTGAALQNEIKQLQATLNSEEQQLAGAPAAQAATLHQAITDQTTLLTQLTLNYSTFQSTQQQNLETVSVATPASTPTVAVSPRVPLNTALGGIAGLLMGLILAGALEYLDQGLKTSEDVVQRLGVPCLGVVPRYPSPSDGRARRPQELLGATEAYRRLRTNLLFASPDSQLRSVVFTSTHAAEGKTQTAANVAVALASAERRVVLIDADMRRPDLHRIFSRPLHNGMSELIMNIHQSDRLSLNGSHATGQPNLTLITSGTIPPNPSELLSSNRATLLVHALERAFDTVIIDTPPVGAVTDALSVAAEASGTVVIVQAGRTNAAQAAATIESLRNVGAKVLGVVLNKANQRRRADYYYYYDSEAAAPDPAVPPKSVPPVPTRSN
jgi:non-specific protein-tyrosine kinase